MSEVSPRPVPLKDYQPATSPPNRTPWSAGTFLAKAQELRRRLGFWEGIDGRSPIHIASESESRDWTRLTFRKYVTDDRQARPDPGLQLYANPDGVVDENGIVGQAYQNVERLEDKSLTQFLLADFYRQLTAAKASPALDYLKESFEQILSLPAWTVRGPKNDTEATILKGEKIYLVEGRHVPDEFLDAIVDAGEKLLAAELAGTLEKSATRADGVLAAAETPTSTPKRRTGRPGKYDRSKQQLVISALAKHHGYQPGGNIENWTPARTKTLAELASGGTSRSARRPFPGFSNESFPSTTRATTVTLLPAIAMRGCISECTSRFGKAM